MHFIINVKMTTQSVYPYKYVVYHMQSIYIFYKSLFGDLAAVSFLYQGLHMLALAGCGAGCGRLGRGAMTPWRSPVETEGLMLSLC